MLLVLLGQIFSHFLLAGLLSSADGVIPLNYLRKLLILVEGALDLGLFTPLLVNTLGLGGFGRSKV